MVWMRLEWVNHAAIEGHENEGEEMSERRRTTQRHARIALLSLAAIVALMPWTVASAADGKITLRFAESASATHPFSTNHDKFWMDEVTRLTQGRITFQFYPSQQLGKAKDLLALTQAGTIDVARMGASYTPDKLPLTAVAELPGMINSSCQGSTALWKLTKEGGDGALVRTEYAPLGLHVVIAAMNAPYEVQTTKKKQVILPADIKGLKLKTLGGASDEAARRLGAVPIQMFVAELFLSLQRGTVDGRFGEFGSVMANKTEGVLKYSTVGARVGGFASVTVIGDKVWKGLPADVQAAMVKAGETTSQNFCTKEDAHGPEIAKDLETEHGWTVHDLSPDERRQWQEELAPVQQQWADELDRRGKPGSEILATFRKTLE
jgi:TRAP-type C4-dicarboxylate transport system substrate-binding protein